MKEGKLEGGIMGINKKGTYIFILLLILFRVNNTYSQNLVPNGNFETRRNVLFIRPLLNLTKWNSPNSSSAEYFRNFKNSYGNQVAKSGLGYVVLEYSYRKFGENNYGDINIVCYIQVKLTKQLKKDSLYCLKLFTSLADNYEYAIENMEAGFSNTRIKSYNNKLYIKPDYSFKLYNPQHLLSNYDEWVENCACIKATGRERYLQIGYFSKDIKLHQVSESKPKFLATNYFIDDVSLTTINNVDSCDCTKKMRFFESNDYLIESYDTSSKNGFNLELKDIYFEVKSTEIDSSHKPFLKDVLNYLVLYPNKKVLIESICNRMDTFYNSCELAKIRAENVVNYFTKRDISPSRFTIQIPSQEIPLSGISKDKKGIKNKVSISILNP